MRLASESGAGFAPDETPARVTMSPVAASAEAKIFAFMESPCSFDFAPQIERGDQAVQMVGVEPEALGGAGDGAATRRDRLQDQLALAAVHRLVKAGRRGGGNARTGFEQRLRQVVGLDDVVLAEDDRALDRVRQLPDVAGPFVAQEQGVCRGRDPERTAADGTAVQGGEMSGEEGDV